MLGILNRLEVTDSKCLDRRSRGQGLDLGGPSGVDGLALLLWTESTSELSYAEDMVGQQNPSPVSSSSGTPPSSPPTNQSYQTPPVEEVMALIPVPEDVQLPSLNTSEDEINWVLLLCAPPPGCQVGGQRCWTCHKTDVSPDSGAAHLF